MSTRLEPDTVIDIRTGCRIFIKNASALSCSQLMEYYWEVSRCWQDPRRAVREKMTVERAISMLLEVRQAALKLRGGDHLARRANALLQEIVRSDASSKDTGV